MIDPKLVDQLTEKLIIEGKWVHLKSCLVDKRIRFIALWLLSKEGELYLQDIKNAIALTDAHTQVSIAEKL